ADAVFFQSELEACELLLERVVRREPMDDAAAGWLWSAISTSAVSGSTSGADAATHVEGVITRLSRSQASWFAVAAAVFASMDPVRLLTLIPEISVRAWLREQNERASHAAVRPAVLPDAVLQVVARAASVFAADDPRLIWLATLAVILACPADLESGLAV